MDRSSTPASNAGACEAIRLANGEPTGVTARLACPSSSFGRLKGAESPGCGSPQNERDASLISPVRPVPSKQGHLGMRDEVNNLDNLMLDVGRGIKPIPNPL